MIKEFTAQGANEIKVNFKGLGNRSDLKANASNYQLLPNSQTHSTRQLMYVTLFKVTGKYDYKTSLLTIDSYPSIRDKINIDTPNKTLYNNLTRLIEDGVFIETGDSKTYLVNHHYADYFKIPTMFMYSRHLVWKEKLMVGALYLYILDTQNNIQFNPSSTSNTLLPCGYTNKVLDDLHRSLSIRFTSTDKLINLHAVILDSIELDHQRSRTSESLLKIQAVKDRKTIQNQAIEIKSLKRLGTRHKPIKDL